MTRSMPLKTVTAENADESRVAKWVTAPGQNSARPAGHHTGTARCAASRQGSSGAARASRAGDLLPVHPTGFALGVEGPVEGACVDGHLSHVRPPKLRV